jgi:hypothetical protein
MRICHFYTQAERTKNQLRIFEFVVYCFNMGILLSAVVLFFVIKASAGVIGAVLMWISNGFNFRRTWTEWKSVFFS